MFLSFIVPVYNTEQYIDKCLQSLLHQDILLGEYEIICINDGSTDGSLEILQRYESKWDNVRVINQENSGVCNARNRGLLAAEGEYVWYVDADDFIMENSLSYLHNEVLNTASDRVIVGNYSYISGTKENLRTDTAWHDTVVWRNIFRRQFLLDNDLLFHYPELSFGEDGLYLYEVKRSLPVTKKLDCHIYYHRVRPSSLSTDMSLETEEKRLQCNIREAEILKGYYEAGGVLKVETANRFMSFLLGSLYRISLMPGTKAAGYLGKMKRMGLYPYKRPTECTIKRHAEIKRDDIIGKVLDYLYINLGSRWGYQGMRLFHSLFRMKQSVINCFHKRN